jgi:galactitol-specific phosphotransferase system IIC component
MLLRRYKHGHGLLLGIVIGLFLAGHALWLFLAGVTVGASLSLACRTGRRFVSAILHRIEQPRDHALITATPRPRKTPTLQVVPSDRN